MRSTHFFNPLHLCFPKYLEILWQYGGKKTNYYINFVWQILKSVFPKKKYTCRSLSRKFWKCRLSSKHTDEECWLLKFHSLSSVWKETFSVINVSLSMFNLLWNLYIFFQIYSKHNDKYLLFLRPWIVMVIFPPFLNQVKFIVRCKWMIMWVSA